MSETQSGGGRRPWLRWLGFFAAGMMGAVAGSTLLSAVRADTPGGFGGWGRHHGFHAAGDPEQLKEHAQMAVELAFRTVGASEEQRSRAREIVARHLAGAGDLRARHLANRQEAAAALTGATVDREKLEAVRKAQLQLADEASVKLTDALADLAEVLTPEQRGQLQDLAERFHR